MDNEEKGISIVEVFRLLYKRIWWVVASVIIFAALVSVLVQFWYNRQTQTYTVNYTIDFPGMSSGVYPDGTPVRYGSSVSLAALESIVAADPSLAGINVLDMFNDGDIKFVQNDEVQADGTTRTSFSLTVGVKYFYTAEQAKTFIRAVAGYPVTRAVQISGGLAHSSGIEAYTAADTFEDKLSALSDQRDYLLDMYDRMIAATSEQYTSDGRTLANYRSEVSSIFQSSDEAYLQSLVQTSSCVINYQKFISEYPARVASIQSEINSNNAKIAAQEAARDELIEKLNSGAIASADLLPFNQLIAKYTADNDALQTQLEEIQKTWEWVQSADGDYTKLDSDVQAILTQMDKYATLLGDVASTFKNVYSSYFDDLSDVSFSSNVLEAQGGINIIIAAAMGAVLGFVIAGVVICIIDVPKYLKSRDGKRAPDPEGQEGGNAEN